MTPADMFAEGVHDYNDGAKRMAPNSCWRYENGTEMVAEWLAGWDFGQYLELSPDEV